MSVVINGRFLARRMTGVERYGMEITKRLEGKARIIRPARLLRGISGHAWEQFTLPRQLRSAEVLWSPANSSPWILRRQAVTLHDASVFDHPEWFKPAFGAWTRLSWKVLAKRAKAILTVSRFSRERLRFHLGIPDEKIYVIPNGVGRPFEPRSAKSIEELRAKYNLKKPYFLFVGTREPRKNLSTLVEAWKYSGVSGNYILMMAGAEGTVFAPVSHAVRSTYDLGYVPDSDLPALYSGATAVILPSLYEGFGLTALEAMACGTPVIASNTTSFPEVVGGAAIMANPIDPIEIANAMCHVVEDRVLADTLRERGLRRAKQFSWDDSAQRILALVESL